MTIREDPFDCDTEDEIDPHEDYHGLRCVVMALALATGSGLTIWLQTSLPIMASALVAYVTIVRR